MSDTQRTSNDEKADSLALLYRQYVDREVGLALQQREQGEVVSAQAADQRMQHLIST